VHLRVQLKFTSNTKTEKQPPTCFFCHPHQIPIEIFLKANKRKYGDKTNMVPRMQRICKDMTKRNQCKQNLYALGLGTKILGMCDHTVSFWLAAFCWQNHYYIMLLFNRDVVHFRIFNVFRVYFSNMEKALLWQVTVSRSSRRLFQKFQKDYVQIPTQKSQILCFRQDDLVMHPNAHQCRVAE
jgi:hypothetical protein